MFRVLTFILLMALPQWCAGLTGDWQEDPHNLPLDKVIQKEFRYFNEQAIRFVGRYGGGTRVINTRSKKLTQPQVEAVKKLFAVVPLEPLTAIEKMEDGYLIKYQDKERFVSFTDTLPLQSTEHEQQSNVTMLEEQPNKLIIETITSYGTVVLELFEFSENKNGELRLSVTIRAEALKLMTPLIIKRSYIPK